MAAPYDSGIEASDVRAEIGLDPESDTPPTSMIDAKITTAEIIVADVARADAPDGSKAAATRVLAASNVLGVDSTSAASAGDVDSFSALGFDVELSGSLDLEAQAERLSGEADRLLSIIRPRRSSGGFRAVTPGSKRH